MNVLVVAAHPDDEVLGCGGAVARLAQEGHDVYIAILGEGITSRYDERGQADPACIQELRERSRQVADLLGVKDLFLDNLPDNRFDTVPLLDVVKRIEAVVQRVQPEAVYTHHGGDLNIDHAVTCRATLTAARPLAGSPVKDVYAYEVASATGWAFGQFPPRFHPNVFVDITDTLDTKIRAMELYETETRPFPHPRSAEALRALAAQRGTQAGTNAAEAFELVRSIR